MDWKKGDIAVCIDDSDNNINLYAPPPVRLNCEYIVHAISICPRCKAVSLDVGLRSRSTVGTSCQCGNENSIIEVHWCRASRFEKKEFETKMSIPFLTD